MSYFKEHFNLRFGKPQVDICSTCEELKIKIKSPHLNDIAKRNAGVELMIHRRRAEKFYTTLQNDQSDYENPQVLSLCMDLMQNKSMPKKSFKNTFT